VSPRKLKGEGCDLINYVSLRFFYVAEDVGGAGGDVIWVASKKLCHTLVGYDSFVQVPYQIERHLPDALLRPRLKSPLFSYSDTHSTAGRGGSCPAPWTNYY
jgi:hypothetical protein